MKLLSLLLLFVSSVSVAQLPSSVKGDVTEGLGNLLVNSAPNRATVSQGWGTQGSNMTVSQDTTNYLDTVKQSTLLTFSGSTNGAYVQSSTYPNIAQFNGVNMMAQAMVKTTLTTLQMCALLGGSVVNCVSIPATGTWVPITANFVGPSSGTMGIIFQTNGTSSTGTLNVGLVYLGRANNTSQVSQAQWVGSVTISGCSSNWATTSTSFGNYSAVTGCTYTASGAVSAPSTQIPGFQISGGPGEYQIVGSGQFGNTTTADSAVFQYSDGTNVSGQGLTSGSGGSAIVYVNHVVGAIYESSALSNATIQIQAKVISGGSANIINSNVPLTLNVFYFPTTSQTGYRADVTPSSATMSTAYSAAYSGTTTSTSFGSITSSLTGTLSVIASRNVTCTQSGTLLGINCTLPRIGNYLVCYSGYQQNSSSGQSTLVALADGSGNQITGAQAQTSSTGGYYSAMGACGTYTASSQAATFQAYGRIVGSGAATFDLTSISVVELDAPMPAPYLTGSVTSSGAGQYHVESATIAQTASSTCSITSQTGSWLTGVSCSAAGTVTGAIASAEFSGTPMCVASSQSGAYLALVPSASSTSVEVQTYSTVPALANATFNLICMGLH